MRELSRSIFSRAFQASVPVFFGYFPLGVTYGVLFSDLGYHWFFATLTSLLVLAGAAQYLSIGMLGAKMGIPEIFATTFLINFRHFFYGLSFLDRFHPLKGLKKAYLIHAQTDETYSILTSNKLKDTQEDLRFCLAVGGLNQSYWVSGSTVGAIIGSHLHFSTKGFDFALTALFVVLAIEQAKGVREYFPFVLAALVAGVSLFFFRGQFLVFSLGMVFLCLLFAAVKKEKAV